MVLAVWDVSDKVLMHFRWGTRSECGLVQRMLLGYTVFQGGVVKYARY